MKDPVKDKLKRFGLFARFGERTFVATIEEAVQAYLAGHPGVLDQCFKMNVIRDHGSPTYAPHVRPLS